MENVRRKKGLIVAEDYERVKQIIKENCLIEKQKGANVYIELALTVTECKDINYRCRMEQELDEADREVVYIKVCCKMVYRICSKSIHIKYYNHIYIM